MHSIKPEPPIQTGTQPGSPPRPVMGRGFFLLAGIIVPLACILLDPVVFRMGVLGSLASNEPLLWRWQPFAYSAIFLTLLFAGLYLLRLRFSPMVLSLVGGVFATGGILSLALGCYLLPTSLIGLMILIGVLGFTPFLTSFVYFCELRWVYHEVLLLRSRRAAAGGILTGAFIYVMVACAFHFTVERGFTSALASAAAGGGVGHLSFYNWAFGDYRLLNAYMREDSEVRQQHLADVYAQLTGRNIEFRLSQLDD